MGGFTVLRLKDCSQENIDEQNKKLNQIGLRKDIRFYSDKNVRDQYEYFKKDDGVFPEHLFPKDKINSFEDFTKFWNTKALGEIFVPNFGTLVFDCYFGRTSARAMKMIGKYLVDNHDQIESTGGSYSTFLERAGLSKLELQIIEESTINENY